MYVVTTPINAVGLGTSTPASTLQVVGGVRAASGAPVNAASNFGYTFSTAGDTGVFNREYDFYLPFLSLYLQNEFVLSLQRLVVA